MLLHRERKAEKERESKEKRRVSFVVSFLFEEEAVGMSYPKLTLLVQRRSERKRRRETYRK